MAFLKGVLLVVVILMIAFGLYLMFGGKKKPFDDGDIDEKNGLPITPRAKRGTLKKTPKDPASAPQAVDEPQADVAPSLADKIHITTTVLSKAKAVDAPAPKINASEDTQEAPLAPTADVHASNADLLFNPTDLVNLHLKPQKDGAFFAGRDVLDVVRAHHLRFGEMMLFHRYQSPEGHGSLLFSLIGEQDEGFAGFDLDTLARDYFKSLTLFVSLPNPEADAAFESMLETAQMMAADLDARMVNDEDAPLDAHTKRALRERVFAAQQK